MRLAPAFRFLSLAALAAILTVAAGCDTGDGDSLYDPDRETLADPVVTSLSPTGVVLAGIDVVTIDGQNFSPDPSKNLVSFDDGNGAYAEGTVLEASPTQLRVRTPNLPNPALRVRVSVIGASNFSTPIPLSLTAATLPFGDLGTIDRPFSIASDANGTLLVSLFSDGGTDGVISLAPDGTRTLYTSTTSTYSDLRFAPDGVLYGARRVQAALRLPEDGSEQIVNPILAGTVKITALDVDAAGRIWGGGDNDDLYRIDPDGSFTTFPFAENVRALLLLNNFLYVASTTDRGAQSKVWRLPVDGAGALGTPSLVVDVRADFGGTALALASAEDGTLYVGTDGRDPILEIPPSGTATVLYPGILDTPAISFAWGPGSTLYVVRGDDPATTLETEKGLYQVETRRARGR